MEDLIFNTIFGSEEKVKIIRYLLRREGEAIDLKEMKKFLKIKKSAQFNKEIKNLKKIGFIGQKGKDYLINSMFPFKKDLSSLILFPSFLYKEHLIESLKKSGNIRLLVFAGALAKDELSAEIDILIVGDNLKENKIDNIISQLESDLGYSINYMILGKKEFEYRYIMFDGLVRGILEGKNELAIKKIDFENLK